MVLHQFGRVPPDVFMQLNIYFLCHDLQVWNEYSKRKLDECLYGSHYKIGTFAHRQWGLRVSTTITTKSSWWLTHQKSYPFSLILNKTALSLPEMQSKNDKLIFINCHEGSPKIRCTLNGPQNLYTWTFLLNEMVLYFTIFWWINYSIFAWSMQLPTKWNAPLETLLYSHLEHQLILAPNYTARSLILIPLSWLLEIGFSSSL